MSRETINKVYDLVSGGTNKIKRLPELASAAEADANCMAALQLGISVTIQELLIRENFRQISKLVAQVKNNANVMHGVYRGIASAGDSWAKAAAGKSVSPFDAVLFRKRFGYLALDLDVDRFELSRAIKCGLRRANGVMNWAEWSKSMENLFDALREKPILFSALHSVVQGAAIPEPPPRSSFREHSRTTAQSWMFLIRGLRG